MIIVGDYRTHAEAEVRREGKRLITLQAGTKLRIERPGSDSNMEGPWATVLNGHHAGTTFELPGGVMALLTRVED